MRFVAGRGAVAEKQAGALMQMAGVFLAEMQLAGALMRRGGVFLAAMQLAVRAVAQKHREEASGKRMQDGQPGAWLARKCTKGEVLYGRQGDARLATGCTAGKEMHDGRGVARRTSTAAPGEPLAHRTAGCGTLLLFGWCA